MSQNDTERWAAGIPAEQGDTCPDSPDGKHSPDFYSLHIEYDGGEAYIDVNCQHCGRSGCAGKFTPSEVNW